MAILFFDGFDRCTITKSLDINFWSFEPQQPVEYEKYAFGGYGYDHTQDNYSSNEYQAYTPNNGHLPSTGYMGAYSNLGTAATNHPAIGAPFGFLALNNIDLSDSASLAPITYLQISGFNLPQSGKSFLNTRIHGIETKDTDYHETDRNGRFGAKHPLVAFCSGNITGLILNIVKTTGNHIELVEGSGMTIGLEVEQLQGVSGTFDLNIANDLADYRIRSVFSNGSAYYHNGVAQASDLADIGGRILMPATNNNPNHIPQSRWCHFQFGIIQTGESPFVQIKLDDIDLLSIPLDDTQTDKDFWSDKIHISGFNYNNIRFFNRTYNGSIPMAQGVNSTSSTNTIATSKANYYEWGANTLIDDVVLNDGSGVANNFLGSNTKVIPFTPGIKGQYGNTSVSDDGEVEDPYREWTTNANSHRIALKNLDGDNGKLTTFVNNALTVVPYGSGNIIIPDDASRWRNQIQDSIGGLKIYTQSKKEFLDSAFVPVVKTGQIDKNFYENTTFLLRPSGGIVDAVEKESVIRTQNNTPQLSPISLFGGSGLNFADGYLEVPFISSYNEFENTYQNSHLFPSGVSNTLPKSNGNSFVIESWVYFTGEEPIDLYTTYRPTGYHYGSPSFEQKFKISCHRDHMEYTMNVSGGLNYVHEQTVKLLFEETAALNEWHHVAFLADIETAGSTFGYPIYSYLNGIRNTKYVLSRLHQNFDNLLQAKYGFRYDRFPLSHTSGNVLYDSSTFPSGDFNIDKNMLVNLTVTSGTLTGSGTLDNPATGIFNFNRTDNVFDIINFTADDTGFLNLHMDMNSSSVRSPTFEVHVNNIKQFTESLNTQSSLNPKFSEFAPDDELPYYNHGRDYAQVFVNSGDNIAIKSTTITTSTTTAEVYVKNLALVSPTGNGPFYFDAQRDFSFSRFSSKIKIGGTNLNIPYDIPPVWIGGHNILSQYRLTQGAKNIDGINRNRYRGNFAVPTGSFLIDKESYIHLGEKQTLTKTRYGRVNEFYVYNNPMTNLPWTTGLIGDPSGVILGVKKL